MGYSQEACERLERVIRGIRESIQSSFGIDYSIRVDEQASILSLEAMDGDVYRPVVRGFNRSSGKAKNKLMIDAHPSYRECVERVLNEEGIEYGTSQDPNFYHYRELTRSSSRADEDDGGIVEAPDTDIPDLIVPDYRRGNEWELFLKRMERLGPITAAERLEFYYWLSQFNGL